MENMMRIVLGGTLVGYDKIRVVIREAGGVYEYAVNIYINICIYILDGADLELV